MWFQLQVLAVKLPVKPEVIFPQLHVFLEQSLSIELGFISSRVAWLYLPFKFLNFSLLSSEGRFMFQVKGINFTLQIRYVFEKFFFSIPMVPSDFFDLFLFTGQLIFQILNFIRLLIFLHREFHSQFLNDIGFFRWGLKQFLLELTKLILQSFILLSGDLKTGYDLVISILVILHGWQLHDLFLQLLVFLDFTVYPVLVDVMELW